jgi:hypothetical protein
VDSYFHNLGFEKVFGPLKSKGVDINSLVRLLVTCKLVENHSIARAGDWAGQAFIRGRYGLPRIDQQTLYRTLERLGMHADEVMAEIQDAPFERYDFASTDVNLDWTSIVLHGEVAELCRYGYSRDHRHDLPDEARGDERGGGVRLRILPVQERQGGIFLPQIEHAFDTWSGAGHVPQARLDREDLPLAEKRDRDKACALLEERTPDRRPFDRLFGTALHLAHALRRARGGAHEHEIHQKSLRNLTDTVMRRKNGKKEHVYSNFDAINMAILRSCGAMT